VLEQDRRVRGQDPDEPLLIGRRWRPATLHPIAANDILMTNDQAEER
jgi:hypothetical protein